MSTGNKLQSLKSKMPKFKKLIVKLSLSIIALLILGGAYMFIRYNYIPNKRVDEIIQKFENGDENTKIEYAIRILSAEPNWNYSSVSDSKIEELLKDKGYLNEAFEYIESMAFNGNAKCQYNLAKLYDEEDTTMISDIVCPCETFCDYWSVQAAEQGYVEAYFRAARCFCEICEYINGYPLYGFGERSREYIKKGAEAGNADCQLAFGDLILNNGRLILTREVEKKCTEEEFEEAKEWWRKSAEQGNKEAKKRLQTLF